MEDNVILQVTINGENGVEVFIGDTHVSPLTFVGILEQVKLDLLNKTKTMEKISNGSKYDA